MEAALLSLKKLITQVNRIVTGIRNSMSAVSNLMMLNVESASVMEWPMVKLVTRASTCRISSGFVKYARAPAAFSLFAWDGVASALSAARLQIFVEADERGDALLGFERGIAGRFRVDLDLHVRDVRHGIDGQPRQIVGS